MSLPDPFSEPAIRDPKKLRNTALVLCAVMLLGGWLVLKRYASSQAESARKAYESFSKETQGSAADPDSENRPAYVYRITKERDLRMLRQDGAMVNLGDLRGKVIAINVFSLRDPQAAARSLAVMKRLAEKRATDPNFILISLIIDPIASDKLIPTLAATSISQDIKLPQWWLGSNEPKTLHKFIKNELKANTYPNEISGKWDYDASIVLIDKNGHIRRGVVPQKRGGPPFIATFDFDQAATWDDKGVKTGTDRNNVDELEVLLNHTIDKLLAEPARDS